MKTSLLLSLVACLWTREVQSEILTGPVTNTANGHFYYLLNATYWTNAEAQAITLGGHLVTINDAAENIWVLNTFGNFEGTSRVLHIGFTDEGQEGQWRWVSGEPVTYLNWAGGEPNNGAGFFPYENVAIMYGEADPRLGSWNDMIGSVEEQQYLGVVEVEPKLSIRVSEVELCWPTVIDVPYQLQYCTSLLPEIWINLGNQIPGTGSIVCFNDTVPPGSTERFYRIVSPPLAPQ